MVTGWYEMIRGKVKPNNEFVSADVSRFKDPGSYEVRKSRSNPFPTVAESVSATPELCPMKDVRGVRASLLGLFSPS